MNFHHDSQSASRIKHSQSHRLQSEGRSGGDHVPVAGVDGGEAFFRRAGDVERVGSAEEGRGRESAEALRGEAEHRLAGHNWIAPEAAVR